MVEVVAQQVLEEAAQCGAATVACGCGVGPFGLKMIKKCGNHAGVEIIQTERGYPAVLTLGCEQQQHLKCIAIGADRMRARAALTRQIAGEEGLDEGEKRR